MPTEMNNSKQPDIREACNIVAEETLKRINLYPSSKFEDGYNIGLLTAYVLMRANGLVT